MVANLSPADKKYARKIGIIDGTSLPHNILAYLREMHAQQKIFLQPFDIKTDASGQVKLNGTEQDLYAIVLSYDDLQKMPRLFETPILLVGTEPQYNLAPAFVVSEFVPMRAIQPEPPANPESIASEFVPMVTQQLHSKPETIEFDKATLEEKIALLSEKVHYARTARQIFSNEFQVNEAALQETIQNGLARSLFDAYHVHCQEFIKELSDRFRSMEDRNAAKGIRNKLAQFAAETGNDVLMEDLFDHCESIGVSNMFNKWLETGYFQELAKSGSEKIPEFLTVLFAMSTGQLKEAPINMELEEHSHSVVHIQGVPIYAKYAKGQHRNSTMHEEKVYEKLHEYIRKIQQYKGEKFVSIPKLLYSPPRKIAEKIDEDVLVFSELPGEQLAKYLYRQNKKLKSLASNEVDEKQKIINELKQVREKVLDDGARFAALAYVIASVERDPDLVKQTFSNKPEDLIGRLRTRFFDPEGDADFRNLPGGVYKAMKEWNDPEIAMCEETVLKNIVPVVEMVAECSPGIDTDRSTQNLLVEIGSAINVHNLDFEIFRNDPLMQSWVQTSLLLSNYNNNIERMNEHCFYFSERNPVIKKDEEVSWHKYSLYEFIKRFSTHLTVVRQAITPWKPKARNTRFQPPAPEKAAREFYALSVYRGGFYYGYFERLRAVRKQDIAFLDYLQDLVTENMRYSILELQKLVPSAAEQLRLLYDSVGRLHDETGLRRQQHDN